MGKGATPGWCVRTVSGKNRTRTCAHTMTLALKGIVGEWSVCDTRLLQMCWSSPKQETKIMNLSCGFTHMHMLCFGGVPPTCVPHVSYLFVINPMSMIQTNQAELLADWSQFVPGQPSYRGVCNNIATRQWRTNYESTKSRHLDKRLSASLLEKNTKPDTPAGSASCRAARACRCDHCGTTEGEVGRRKCQNWIKGGSGPCRGGLFNEQVSSRWWIHSWLST